MFIGEKCEELKEKNFIENTAPSDSQEEQKIGIKPVKIDDLSKKLKDIKITDQNPKITKTAKVKKEEKKRKLLYKKPGHI